MTGNDHPPICIFLDRDGVVNELIPGDYVKKTEEFHFRDGVLNGLSRLSKLTPYIFIITNQQGIGKNIMTESELEVVHQFMQGQIEKAGGRLAGIYYCPHLVSQECECRKPGTGMIKQIVLSFPEIVDYPKLLLGDSISDIELGIKIGAFTFGMKHEHNRNADWTSFDIKEIHHFDEFVNQCIKYSGLAN